MIPDWLSRFTVAGTWSQHIARGSVGGIDWAMPVGIPLQAPPGGGSLTFQPFNGTGGHTATIRRSDGSRTQYMHLSAFTGAPRTVVEGEIVGLSGGQVGAPGAGSSTGPHLHAHDITPAGVRVPPFSTVPLSTAALAGTEKFPNQEEEEMTNHVIQINDGKKKLGGGSRFYEVGPAMFVELDDTAAANATAEIFQSGKTTPNVTYKTLYQYARNAGTVPEAELAIYRTAAGL